jgi:hypothetical protein
LLVLAQGLLNHLQVSIPVDTVGMDGLELLPAGQAGVLMYQVKKMTIGKGKGVRRNRSCRFSWTSERVNYQ